MRRANVYMQGVFAGILTEEAQDAYVFAYAPDYNGPPISLTMPVRSDPYGFDTFPAFFDGLLPEGVLLEGLLYTKDGDFCYFIKRFDRKGRGKKRPVEDFAQLTGRSRETKYDASMEQVAGVVDRFCTFPAVERVNLFRRTLVAYLTGNEDMHLKNFSLITRQDIVSLSPAYDLLNTTIALPNPMEELALPLRGKKSKLNRGDLIDYYGRERLKLPPRAIDRVLADLATALPRWYDLLDRSFLSPAMRTAYRDVLQSRAGLLRL